MMTELDAKVSRVRELRLSVSIMKDMIDKRMALWEEENRELLDAIECERIRLREEEENLREATLEAYQETGNKRPAPGVGIRIIKVCKYDPDEAKRWAIQKGACLKLDEAAYKAAMIKCIFFDMPGTVKEDAQATIAKEL